MFFIYTLYSINESCYNNISYSSNSLRRYSSELNKSINLYPWYVTGYIDGEGCFNIWVARSKSNLIGWQVQVRFIIEVNIKDHVLLLKIKDFFVLRKLKLRIGSVTTTKSVAKFAVFGLDIIINVILKHF